MKGPRANGFTLIELLAAMVAGSLLLASLSWTLATLSRELRASDRQLAGDRLYTAAPLLGSLIEQMLPAEAGGAPIVAERGGLAFDTVPPAALAAGGPVRALLAIRPWEGGEALFVRFAPGQDGAALPAAALAEERLTDAWRDISFDYAQPPLGQEGQGAPPRLVTIRFTGEDGETRVLALAPRLNSSGDCRFDPISMECRK